MLSTIRQAGLRVPAAVSVLAVNADALLNTAGALPPSSVALPVVTVGFTAAAILDGLLNGTRPDPPPITKVPPPYVVPRATTGVTFVEGPRSGRPG